MPCYAIIENGLKKQLDQDGYSSRSRRTSLRSLVFSFSTSSCGPDIRSPCSFSGHHFAIPCQAMAASEPTCSVSKGQHPNLMKPAAATFIDTAYRLRATVKPLLIAMRTASRRNSSVYLVAIPYLLHSKHCSKETRTKPRQDQSVSGRARSALKLICATRPRSYHPLPPHHSDLTAAEWRFDS